MGGSEGITVTGLAPSSDAGNRVSLSTVMKLFHADPFSYESEVKGLPLLASDTTVPVQVFALDMFLQLDRALTPGSVR